MDLALAVGAELGADQLGELLGVSQRSRAAVDDVARKGRALLDLAGLGPCRADQRLDDLAGRRLLVDGLDLGARELGEPIATVDPQRGRAALDGLDLAAEHLGRAIAVVELHGDRVAEARVAPRGIAELDATTAAGPTDAQLGLEREQGLRVAPFVGEAQRADVDRVGERHASDLDPLPARGVAKDRRQRALDEGVERIGGQRWCGWSEGGRLAARRTDDPQRARRARARRWR